MDYFLNDIIGGVCYIGFLILTSAFMGIGYTKGLLAEQFIEEYKSKPEPYPLHKGPNMLHAFTKIDYEKLAKDNSDEADYIRSQQDWIELLQCIAIPLSSFYTVLLGVIILWDVVEKHPAILQ